MRCAIFQINTKLLVTYWNINIFTQEILYPSIIWKKLALSIANAFLKHPLFTTFSLFLKGSEVCNISNKSWLPNNSANKIFLHKKPYTRPLLQKNCALHVRIFEKYPLFTTFLLVLIVNEVCNITNKKQPPSNLGKYQYFYTRDLISSTHFERKLVLSIASIFWNIHFSQHFHYF